MTTSQLFINMAAVTIWVFSIAVLVDRWRQRKGKRPPGREE